MIDGLYQSAICFFVPFLVYYKGGFVTMSGFDLNSTSEIGVFVACATITVSNLYILMNQQHWDWLFLLIVALSVLTVWVWTGIYSCFQANPTFYKVAAHVFGTASFWAATILIIVVCLLPRFAGNVVQKFYFPYDSDIIREEVYLHLYDQKPAEPKVSDELGISPVPSPPKKKGFLSSMSSSSGKSRSSTPQKMEQQYTNDDEQPIYAHPAGQSNTPRPASQSDAESADVAAAEQRGHHRRSTDHTERWHPHASPMIPEIVEIRS
jgi:phospholipid-translocating ATPase